MIFLESPYPILLLGVVVEVILIGLLITTRRGVFLWPIGGVLLLVIAGVAVERWVVTERERIEATLHEAAAAIQSNYLRRVEQFIAKNPKSTVLSRATSYMAMVEFSRIRLHDIKIGEINKLTSPPTVDVDLYGTAEFTDRTGMIPYRHYQSNFRVELVKQADGWKVNDVWGDPNQPLGKIE